MLEHLTERRRILERLAAALRPGGWMVVEDYDWTGFGFEDDDPRFDRMVDRVVDAIITFMQQAGFEPRYGRRVVERSRRGPHADHRLPLARLRLLQAVLGEPADAVVGAGLLSGEDAGAAAARFAEDRRVQTPLMMAGIGRS
ncbi:hypothetical protein [Candidatus Mycobacterium methanotrophicum]|uniref:Methyltransferase type 11 domain-containing protein n=1 Tax=Candidatus Mycobacterium methanotrophicum TaxID=2943498 RepID=A0ABY4QHW5_9MYCO|nr:hypothetical protein [Candidatus Mycobacterium methanotrophicum]UQX10082.1 hypothetical protein M5I08_17965 [Candidatus Mycobacterium methanotrophicum]